MSTSASSVEVERLCDRYAELLLVWNRKINLTAARTKPEILDQHVADCRAVVGHIPECARRVLDVGSGAGLPGLIIAIARPEVSVVLLEPVQKNRAFLSTAARELGLGRVEARAERLADHAGRDYDVAVSRATWSVPEWLERAAPFVKTGGRILAMEGREQHALPAGATRHPYELGDKTRAIIVTLRR
jgi:16S rRNA (guanine527-N7)-methyltransferase